MPPSPFLVGVIDVFEAELFAVGEEAEEVAGIAASRDDEEIFDARFEESLDGVINHRLVIDGQQMFIGDFGGAERGGFRCLRLERYPSCV